MRFTGRIGNSTQPFSTGSTPPNGTYYRTSAFTDSILSCKPFTTALLLAVDASTEEACTTQKSSTTQEEKKFKKLSAWWEPPKGVPGV